MEIRVRLSVISATLQRADLGPQPLRLLHGLALLRFRLESARLSLISPALLRMDLSVQPLPHLCGPTHLCLRLEGVRRQLLAQEADDLLGRTDLGL